MVSGWRACSTPRHASACSAPWANLTPSPQKERFGAACRAAQEWFRHLKRGGHAGAMTIRVVCSRYVKHLAREKRGTARLGGCQAETGRARRRASRSRAQAAHPSGPRGRAAFPRLRAESALARGSRRRQIAAASRRRVEQDTAQGAGAQRCESRRRAHGQHTQPRHDGLPCRAESGFRGRLGDLELRLEHEVAADQERRSPARAVPRSRSASGFSHTHRTTSGNCCRG